MATRKPKVKKTPRQLPGMRRLSGIGVLPERAAVDLAPAEGYKYKYTTGPFLLPQNAGSLDWELLNNDTTRQKARVTVYKCPVGVKTVLPPGALVFTMEPGECYHNANTYTPGFGYEIVVECNSQLVFPYVSVWPGNMGYAMPGTAITAGMFLPAMP